MIVMIVIIIIGKIQHIRERIRDWVAVLPFILLISDESLLYSLQI